MAIPRRAAAQTVDEDEARRDIRRLQRWATPLTALNDGEPLSSLPGGRVLELPPHPSEVKVPDVSHLDPVEGLDVLLDAYAVAGLGTAARSYLQAMREARARW